MDLPKTSRPSPPTGRAPDPAPGRDGPGGAAPEAFASGVSAPVPGEGIALEADEAGLPIHRGWPPAGPRRRWMEPFILVLLAEGRTHGYAIVSELGAMGVAPGELDYGAVYRTLRELEATGHVTSHWSAEASGPQRRDYELTARGYAMLDEWSAVMRERGRLIAEFDARFLAAVMVRRRAGARPG
jgi:PadR family transcriptional regulator, regulatory protein PadR